LLKRVRGSCGYSRRYRIVEIAAITAFLVLITTIGVRLVLQIDGAGTALWIAVSAFAGIVISDFLSGAAHWAGDTLGDERTPFLGNHVIAPFRTHHVDPQGITRHDFIEINGNTCIALVPALLVLAGISPATPGISSFVRFTLAFTCFFVFCTNQFHKWAHESNPAPFVRFLQRWGLILSPERHAIHHADTSDHYCITVGWMNPLLARIGFFRLAESLVASLSPRLLNSQNVAASLRHLDH
jgi:TMEM189-like protein